MDNISLDKRPRELLMAMQSKDSIILFTKQWLMKKLQTIKWRKFPKKTRLHNYLLSLTREQMLEKDRVHIPTN